MPGIQAEREMEIYFKIRDFETADDGLTKEWMETDQFGNYAASTILGMNTRKEHGLFVFFETRENDHLVLLSHLQEEFYDGEQQYPIFTVEYEGQMLRDGFQNQVEFRLDPFPTFSYRCGNVILKKSIYLVRNMNRLVVRYEVSGPIKKGSKLIVRPFFAFRSSDRCSDPSRFVDTEVYPMENHFRFLPFPDSPEILMFHSAGQFISASMWYHNFIYRHDSPDSRRKEDLLNPGFFELPIDANSEIFLSLGLDETSQEALQNYHQNEIERRTAPDRANPGKNEIVRYLVRKMDDFNLRDSSADKFLISKLPKSPINLTAHYFMARRLILGSNSPDAAVDYCKYAHRVLHEKKLQAIFKDELANLVVDPISPFALIYFLNEFHSRFGKSELLTDSSRVAEEIVHHVRKNHLPLIQRKKHLIFQSKPADKQLKKGIEGFYPGGRDFLLNVFWYKSLMMTAHLLRLNNSKGGKYVRLAGKVQQHFTERFQAAISDEKFLRSASAAAYFHPTMIYAITSPFPILDGERSRALFVILVKRFMAASGIKYPVNPHQEDGYVISPLLLSEFLNAWQRLIKEKKNFFLLFKKISEKLQGMLYEGTLGYLPDVIKLPTGISPEHQPPSGLATSEILYFLRRISEIEKEQ